jgi:hypothetical protein
MKILNHPESVAGAQSTLPVEKGGKAVPVTGPEGPKGCERLMLPHFLGSRLTDGGEVVSLTHRPPFIPKEILFDAESSTPGPQCGWKD